MVEEIRPVADAGTLVHGEPGDFRVDLREYGVERYGNKPDEGGRILQWVMQNYRVAAMLGDDPLDYQKRGAMIFRRQGATAGGK